MKRLLIGLIAGLVLAATPVLAEFPEKDLQGIIQWGAGGSADIIMRSVTPHAEEVLGRKVVMINRTGGVGAIATKFVMTRPADGYTLLMGAENPQLYKIMGLADVDYADFIPINLLARGVAVLIANKSAPFETFKEFAAYAQAHPGQLKIGSTGPGGLPAVVASMLSSKVDLPLTSVPYDGEGPAVTALQGSAIDVIPIGLSAAIHHVKADRVKALALIDIAPHPALPGVPSIVTDYPEFNEYLPWGPFFGVFVKKGTPEEAVAKLQAAYAEGARHPDFQALLDQQGYTVMNISGAEAEDFLKRWQSVTSWLLWEAGGAKSSPEQFGIPRP